VTDPSPIAFALAAQLALASPGADAWKRAELGVVRGVTIGPIENGLHPGVGYGSPAYDRALVEAERMGATWVAITPFGRVLDLAGRGIDPSFEARFERNRADIVRAVEMAHGHGLRVMLVPHLWIESGDWRGDLDPKTDEAWKHWADSYDRFLSIWANVAQSTHAEMFSVGVELRSWLTTTRAPSFARVLEDVRRIYRGVLTYSANWDDVEDTVILGQIDVIGINAFYKLAEIPGTSADTLLETARGVRAKIHDLAERWQKPVLFTETGYTTRPDPAYRPWEWPDRMSAVRVDVPAQAAAYRALITPLVEEPCFAGLFVWRVYSDPDDTSQEAPWGFSPRGKDAEIVIRDAFAARWAGDPWWRLGWGASARTPGLAPY
jgi:hypothetical protein